MSVLRHELRHGVYADSVVLMQLQAALGELPGVADVAVVMATAANRALLAEQDLLPEDLGETSDADLLVAVRAEDAARADDALTRVDALLAGRRGGDAGSGDVSASGDDYRPKSLETAARRLPDARWVAVSVPGRYAAEVARRALERNANVFLYSDNVALADEVELKRDARERGLLVMGPDCGTAIVGGVGLGFANRVRRGPVGLVGASGTGLQAITSRLDELGVGISHALGTGGRDLSAEVGAATARQALALLAADRDTRVVVLVSKPPAPAVAARLLAAAARCGKPVVVDFLGWVPPVTTVDNLHFVAGLDQAAHRAATLAGETVGGRDEGRTEATTAAEGRDHPPDATTDEARNRPAKAPPADDPRGGFLRALFAGGTLATETLLQLRLFLAPLSSNVALAGVEPLADPASSRGHTVLDLGDDQLTVGRLHPMIDPDLRLRRLEREAADDDVGLLLLDVVLGEGADADPAATLAPVIATVRTRRPALPVVVMVIGTVADPQDRETQIERLRDAGAEVYPTAADALARVCRWALATAEDDPPPVADADALTAPPAVINVGLEIFHRSLRAQGADAVQVDWRPPAGGDEKLMALLRRLRSRE